MCAASLHVGRLCPVLSLFLACVAPLAADRNVAVRATADPTYVDEREADPNRAEHYVFLKGKFFPGAIRDNSLERTEIGAITRVLAPYLAQQRFLPAAEVASADIVIAVHWGMTVSLRQNMDYVEILMEQARERQAAARDFANETYGLVENEGSDPRSETGDVGQEMLKIEARMAAAAPDYDWARMAMGNLEHDLSQQPAATILGFSDLLRSDARRPVMGEDARTLRHYLDEERYFIVLMAYDLKNREDGKPLQRLWTARLSLPSNGTNFREAVSRLGLVGADYFGTDQPGLKIDRAPRRDFTGEVEIGEATVIESP